MFIRQEADGVVRLVRMAKGTPEDLDEGRPGAIVQVDTVLPAGVWAEGVSRVALARIDFDALEAAMHLHGIGVEDDRVLVAGVDPTEWARTEGRMLTIAPSVRG